MRLAPSPALIVAAVGFAAAVSPVPGGAFQVALYAGGRTDAADVPFVVVAV